MNDAESSPPDPDIRSPPRGPGSVCTSAAAVLCLAVSLGVARPGLGPAAADTASPAGPHDRPAAPLPTPRPRRRPRSRRLPAELLIDEAKAKLAKLQSCAAEHRRDGSRCSISHLTIKGRYRKAPDYRVYFLLTLSGLPETTGTTLQVCDGETLWDYQAILESQIYHKFSIKPVMERLNSPEIDPKMKEQFKEGMGFAGPEVLLIGLRRSFRFEQEKEDGKLGDKPVWILRGTWKSRQGLIGPDQRPGRRDRPLAALYPQPGDALPGQGRRLALQARPEGPDDRRSLIDTRKKGPDGR